MKTEIETVEAAAPHSPQSTVRPAPSLRIPVTAANRGFLRWLRAAELSAWEAGLAWERGNSPANLLSAHNRQM